MSIAKVIEVICQSDKNWEDAAQQGVSEELRMAYDALLAQASACTECGVCTERCPFGVDVIPRMRQAIELFESF